MMDKEIRRKYQADFDIAKRMVNAFDPCGLINAGAPDDEYNGLIHQILSRIYNKMTTAEIRSFVLHEIEHHFGCSVTDEDKTQFSIDIDKMLKQLKSHLDNSSATQS